MPQTPGRGVAMSCLLHSFTRSLVREFRRRPKGHGMGPEGWVLPVSHLLKLTRARAACQQPGVKRFRVCRRRRPLWSAVARRRFGSWRAQVLSRNPKRCRATALQKSRTPAFRGFIGIFMLGFSGCLPAATRESFALLFPSNLLSPQTEQTLLSAAANPPCRHETAGLWLRPLEQGL